MSRSCSTRTAKVCNVIPLRCAANGLGPMGITDELPRNPTGKIMKKDLRKPYWEGRDRATI